MARLQWRFGSSLPSSTKKKHQKNVVKVGPPLKNLSGSLHAKMPVLKRAYTLNKLRIVAYLQIPFRLVRLESAAELSAMRHVISMCHLGQGDVFPFKMLQMLEKK